MNKRPILIIITMAHTNTLKVRGISTRCSLGLTFDQIHKSIALLIQGMV